ncbi:release factor glutamine methyltransferase [Novosphingobium sp. CF614]|uniref:methyltransferase n=1 Tax=Novosphingobium sp. CF614 TaxID=1884364 RepID=UPI0008ECD875|nr:methyltransferase [Novosphingobium sp. CF614]SFG02127.1 release factor glutamine methyltransferase [Novosphingobium sp. CF614]
MGEAAQNEGFGDPGQEVPTLVRARWQSEVRRLIALMATHREGYRCSSAGLDISVQPDVFSPAYFTDSEWFAIEVARIVQSRSLLDIGTGTGIVALAAARGGANVTATDINPAAIENARINFAEHAVDIPVFGGDVYGALPEPRTFDFIFWNHPFNMGTNPEEDNLSLCGFDYEYRGLRQFIQESRQYLAPEGRLILGTSTFAEVSRIEALAAEVGMETRILQRKQTPLQWRGAAVTELRIVEFTAFR